MAGSKPTAEGILTVAALAAQLEKGRKRAARLSLLLGEVSIEVRSNSIPLVRYLAGYFGPFVTEPGTPDIVVTALEASEFVPPLALQQKAPDPGKTRVKEEYADLVDGRLVRKILTGMVFLMADDVNLAIGPCFANANQVINFVNSRYLERLLRRGGLLCHASACAATTGTFVVAGWPGAGKSTLALHLLNHGFDFVSNDRLVISGKPGAVRVNGVPKLPRVNPGTIIGQPRLHSLMTEEDLAQARSLPAVDLWRMERKFDVPLEATYGPGRFRLEADLAGLLILDWRPNKGPCRIEAFDPIERPELLVPLVKDPGLFLLAGRESHLAGSPAALGRDTYARLLARTPAHHLTGGVDFAAAVRLCMRLSKKPAGKPATVSNGIHRYPKPANKEELSMSREFKMKGSMGVEGAAGYLDQLAESLRAGTVSMQKGTDSIVLQPAPTVWIEVEGERSKSKETLSVEISWASAVADQTDASELIISSEPPAMVQEDEPAMSDPAATRDETSEEDEA